MSTVQIGKNTVELYDSIDELPWARYHMFNKYLLIDAGIGSDLNDVNMHVDKIARFIHIDDKKAAAMQLDNLKQSLYFIVQGVSPKHMAFVPLVKSINGMEWADLSEEGVKKCLAALQSQPATWFTKMVEQVKKKLMRS